MKEQSNQRHSFILRIWWDGENKEWHGWVQHANTGLATIVRTAAELLAFIDQQKGEDGLALWQEQSVKEKTRKTGIK